MPGSARSWNRVESEIGHHSAFLKPVVGVGRWRLEKLWHVGLSKIISVRSLFQTWG